jgi:hypothetical protein
MKLRIAIALLAGCGLAAGPAQASGWQDFHAIMWQTQSAARYTAMRKLGVDGAMVFGFRGEVEPARIPELLAAPLKAGMRIYLENVATDFYSAYHRWTPQHPTEPNFLFTEAQRRYRADPSDQSVFIRTPGLSDPVWLARIATRMRDNGRAFAPYRPLFYNLGDEPGIADLAAAWDFDRAPSSLSAMRLWLRRQYPSLAALNRQWGSDFASWDAVTPPTTTAALARTDGNESAWTDFRSFMDEAFAHALRVGTDGLHEGDPDGLSGIEGTQAPGPGGYDYIRLAHAVDVMEMYGAGDSTDIARSFNPDLVVLTTGFGGGPAENRRIWHSMLQGARGLILWDSKLDFVDDAGAPSQRARELAPLLLELRGGLGAQLIALRPAPSPVAILYSPTSQHVQWLLARRAEGTPWNDRTSETEWKDDNPMRRAIAATVRTLTHLGLPPHFVSAAMLEHGLLSAPGAPRALVLPQALALSPAAVAAIRQFQASGGVVVADGAPGAFDGHGRRLDTPALADLAPHLVPLDGMADALARAGIIAGFSLRQTDGGKAGGVAIRVLRSGGVTVLALERDAAGAPPSGRLELRLAAPATIRDLRDGRFSPAADRIAVTLDPVAPTLLAISPAPLPGPTVAGPAEAASGDTVTWRLALTAPDSAAHALRIRLFPPSGQPDASISGVQVLRGAGAEWQATFPPDAPTGRWRIEATDILSGKVAHGELQLKPR